MAYSQCEIGQSCGAGLQPCLPIGTCPDLPSTITCAVGAGGGGGQNGVTGCIPSLRGEDINGETAPVCPTPSVPNTSDGML